MQIQTERFNKQSHVKYECKYHIIITPKYRKKLLYGPIRKELGEILRALCQQKGVEILEGHAMKDHVHLLMSIPPKYSIAEVVGFIKGKSAIRLHQKFAKRFKNYYGKSFWSRGYFVSTVGMDEEVIRNYVKNQEERDQQSDGTQMDFRWN